MMLSSEERRGNQKWKYFENWDFNGVIINTNEDKFHGSQRKRKARGEMKGKIIRNMLIRQVTILIPKMLKSFLVNKIKLMEEN